MNNLEIAYKLKQAKTLISNPSRWTQQVVARNNYGLPISPQSPQAVSWCAEGAIRKICADNTSESISITNFLNQVALEHYNQHFSNVNDYEDHPTVMNLFDKAIAKAEELI